MLFAGGQVKALATLGSSGVAWDINATGLIAGSVVDIKSSESRAVAWSASTGAIVADFGIGQAQAVNASNQIVGKIGPPGGGPSPTHAFLYSGGILTDLGAFGGISSEATAINSRGMITGSYGTLNREQHGSLYSGGSMVDLNSPIAPGGGLLIERGSSINDAGQILVEAIDQAGRLHDLILTPPGGVVPPDPFFTRPPIPGVSLPEPGSLALLGLGSLVGLPRMWRACLRRREARETERPSASQGRDAGGR